LKYQFAQRLARKKTITTRDITVAFDHNKQSNSITCILTTKV